MTLAQRGHQLRRVRSLDIQVLDLQPRIDPAGFFLIQIDLTALLAVRDVEVGGKRDRNIRTIPTGSCRARAEDDPATTFMTDEGLELVHHHGCFLLPS